ncbi:MAG: hypothetical protein EON54_23740, partial [Alcaligenaceae bacterium]
MNEKTHPVEAEIYPVTPKWLAEIVGEYGVAGGREPNPESVMLWPKLIQGINRFVRESIDAALRARGAEDAADHNFNLIQYFDHWLLEQGHYNVEHTEEEHGAMAPAMNWIASVQAMIAARGAVPSVKYVPVAASLRDKNWQHPNDDEPCTDACNAALDERGDNSGQGLDGFWKWGFRAGFNAALAASAAPMSVQGPSKPLGTIVLNVNGKPVSAFEHRGVAQYVDPEIYDATYPQNAPHRLAQLVEFQDAAPQPPAALPGEQDAARSIELTDDVRFILGFICFQCMHIVQALRLGGREINAKAEDEQAAAIHFMLNHYLADRENWRENVNAELRNMAAKGRTDG